MNIPKPGARYAYDLANGQTVIVEAKADGTFYGAADSFDFEAPSECELIAKLTRWGASFVGVE